MKKENRFPWTRRDFLREVTARLAPIPSRNSLRVQGKAFVFFMGTDFRNLFNSNLSQIGIDVDEPATMKKSRRSILKDILTPFKRSSVRFSK